MESLLSLYNVLDQSVFGTEVKLITFVVIILQLFVSGFGLIALLSRPNDTSRKRFFILLMCFLVYNICGGFFPDPNIQMSEIIQLIFAYLSGIILPVYFFYYLTKELDINLGFLFNHRVLFAVLIVLFISSYLVPYFITKDPNSARQVFIIIPLIIGLMFCLKTVIFVFKNFKVKYTEEHFRFMANAGNFSIIFMVGLPVTTAIGDYQVIEVLLVNTSFVIITLAYLKRHIYLGRLEEELIQKFKAKNISAKEKTEINKEYDSDVNGNIVDLMQILTDREKELVTLLLDKEMSYQDISDKLFIARGTVSKHASNIYKKAKVKDRKSFKQKYL